MVNSETWALVPVKRFAQAKSRLSSILSATERAHLAETMLRDVLGNLGATRSLTGIAVVSADPEAVAISKSFGAAVMYDSAEAGINAAVQCGLDALCPYGRRVLVIPSDIPFARPSDFENIIALLEHTPVALVPALSDGGTNALAMRSPDLLQPQFGEESFRLHRELARRRRLGCSVLKSDQIGTDIDGPLDLASYLMSPGNRGLTGSFLDEINIAERFGTDNAPAPLRL
jgi:2-phospho-L-lactate guanylyltransferase